MSVCTYLLIDNRSRPENSDPFDYTITFGGFNGKGTVGCSIFSGVESVELKSVIMGRPQTENYVIVDIEELNGQLITLENNTFGSFAVLLFDHAPVRQGRDTVRLLKGDFVGSSRVLFDPPLAKLNKLRIKFLKYGGEKLSVADFLDVNGAPLPKHDQHSMVLCIKHRV